MASAPNNGLPLFYKDLVPLNVDQHKNFRLRPTEAAPFLIGEHAVPLTVGEFAQCQRFLPIVFSSGEDPVPLALMGLNEGANTLVDADGKLLRDDGFIPGYIRRYPWMLARLNPDQDEMSLCFDPTVPEIGEFEEGERLIHDDGAPTAFTQSILKFCEEFETGARRTTQFMADLKELDLLMEGELTVQINETNQPFTYRGFQMVNEAKLLELRGDQLRKINQNGMLAVIYAHLFSLQGMREVFARQQQLGLGPVVEALQPA